MTEIILNERNTFQKKLIFNQQLLEKRISDEQEKIINLELENEELRTMLSSLTLIANDTLNNFNILKAEINQCNYKSLYFDLKAKYEREVGSLQRSNKILTKFLCEKQREEKISNKKNTALPSSAQSKIPSHKYHRRSVSVENNKTIETLTHKQLNLINLPPKASLDIDQLLDYSPKINYSSAGNHNMNDVCSVLSDDKTPCLSSFNFSTLNDFGNAESPITEAKLDKLFEHKNISLVNMSRPVRNNNSGRIKIGSPFSASNSSFTQSSDEFPCSDLESIQSSNFEFAHSGSKISFHTDVSSVMSNSSFNDSLESFSKFSLDNKEEKFSLDSVIDDTLENVKFQDFEKPERPLFKVRSRSDSASSIIKRFFK